MVFVVVQNNGVVGNFCALDETSSHVYVFFDVMCDVSRSVVDDISCQAVVVKVERIYFTWFYSCF